MNARTKVIYMWCSGMGIAVGVLWIVTSICMDSRPEQIFDSSLGRVIFKPGSARQCRKEGWATTRYGRYGFPGIPDVTKLIGPKIMIWGDSHVEAQEVTDADKMATVANKLWGERHPDQPMSFLSWGESGANFANHCFDIPRYEKVFPDLCRHYIVMSFTRRAFPNDPRSASALFRERDGVFSISEIPTAAPSSRSVLWRGRLAKAGLHVVFKLYAKLSRSAVSNLRFGLGPVKKAVLEPELPPFDAAYAGTSFGWILRELKRRTDQPVCIVYIPEVPRIVQGRIVTEVQMLDPDEALRLSAFKRACCSAGIGFVDLTESFCQAVRQEGLFPRGFMNTRPGEGHLNALGHRLVSEAIVADAAEFRP